MTHPPKTIALVGLGYVGLPLAVAFARAGFAVTGFDLNADKVRRLTAGDDPTGSVEPSELAHPGLSFTSDEREIRGRDFYIVAIPTPIDAAHKPDLTALHLASELVGTSSSRPSETSPPPSPVSSPSTRTSAPATSPTR